MEHNIYLRKTFLIRTSGWGQLEPSSSSWAAGDVAGGAALALGYAQRVGASAAQVVAVAGALLVGIQLGLHLGQGLLPEDRRDRRGNPLRFGPRGMG